MFSASSDQPDIPHKSLQIKQDDKFFSRLLSKESSVANPSLRVYYGGVSVAVPFVWESQPGTPKYTFCETTLPPLTPPPSYYSNCNKKPDKKHSRSNLLRLLFPRINLKKSNASVSSSCSSSSTTSSPTPSLTLSSPSFPQWNPKTGHNRSRFLSSGPSFDSGTYDEEATVGSPTSTLCFGIIGRSNGGVRGSQVLW